ncbi:MAG: hypothetical protein JW870_05515 [Candidatus Delongbacteria bacterium]|nr:hypothetical protein [Candidatus Delongbacteria bacterium]
MSTPDEKKDFRIEIAELFIAQVSLDRFFVGIISRSKVVNGNPHLFSRIVLNDGLLMACAGNQKVLGKMLDEMSLWFWS